MNMIRPYDGPPNKERLIAAMRGQPTDRVPNFEVLIEDSHVERLLGRQAGNTLGVGGDPAKGSEAAEGVRYIAEYVEAARGTGIGVMFLCGCIFQTLYEFVIGLNDFMLLAIDEPGLIDQLMSRSADYFAELVEGALAEGVERDVKEHMQVLKPGGRWIAGSSHSVVNYIPHENFAAMINAIHEHGRYQSARKKALL